MALLVLNRVGHCQSIASAPKHFTSIKCANQCQQHARRTSDAQVEVPCESEYTTCLARHLLEKATRKENAITADKLALVSDNLSNIAMVIRMKFVACVFTYSVPQHLLLLT